MGTDIPRGYAEGIKARPSMIEDAEREPWREPYQNALAALRTIRETIETLGPSREAVLMLYWVNYDKAALSRSLHRFSRLVD
ncbi:MAG: hypothetical protein QOC72_2870 [Methylobacteriaceae bacterium]|jgi:hypothetical protein|nr:hypothetical protein [Methylobacteriaceae bacterium]